MSDLKYYVKFVPDSDPNADGFWACVTANWEVPASRSGGSGTPTIGVALAGHHIVDVSKTLYEGEQL